MSTAKTQGLFNGITVEFTAGTEATRGFVAVMLYNALFLDSVKYNTSLNQNTQTPGSSIMERVFNYDTFVGTVVATNNLGTASAAARFDAAHNGYKVTDANVTKAFYAESATQMDAYFGTTVKVFYKADVDTNGAYTNSICIPQQGTIESSIVNKINTDASGNYVINGTAFAPANVLVATVENGVGTYKPATVTAPTGTAAYRVFVANGVAYVTPGAVGRYYAELRAGTAKYEFGVAAIATADDALLAGAGLGTGLDLEENAVLNLNKVVSGSYVEYFYDGAVMDAYKLTKTTAKYVAYSENTYKFGDNWYQESAYAGSVDIASVNPTGANTNLYVDSFGKIAYAPAVVTSAPGYQYVRPTFAFITKIEASFAFDPATGHGTLVGYAFEAYKSTGEKFTGITNDMWLLDANNGVGFAGQPQANAEATTNWLNQWSDNWFNRPYLFTQKADGSYVFQSFNNLYYMDAQPTWHLFTSANGMISQNLAGYTTATFDATKGLSGYDGVTTGFCAAYNGMHGQTTWPDAQIINAGSYLVYSSATFASGAPQLVLPASDARIVVLTTASGNVNSDATDGSGNFVDNKFSAINFYTPATLPQGTYGFVGMFGTNLAQSPDTIVLVQAPAGPSYIPATFEAIVTNRVVTINATNAAMRDVNYTVCKLDGTTATIVVTVADPTTSTFAPGDFINYSLAADGTETVVEVDRAPNVALYYPGTIDGWYYFAKNTSALPGGFDDANPAPVNHGTQYGFTADCKVYVVAADGSVRTGTTADLKYCAHLPGTAVADQSCPSVSTANYVYVYNVRVHAMETDAATGLSFIDVIYVYEALCG
ncbi:MAG: hypothetical protein IKD06_02245 [Clostridia bacterium]|nr:hypothetical protein [Clostridia bacterium]